MAITDFAHPPVHLKPTEVLDLCEPSLKIGSCLLSNSEAAEIVQQALLYFERDRYFLSAWCIMPNHVHVVVSPIGDHRLDEILHSWKTFSSRRINKIFHREGTLWERESFDHLIRSAEHWEKFGFYTENNPVAAGLCKTARDWQFSSCGAGFQPAPEIDFVDPRETPFPELRSRGELPHLMKEGGTYFVTFRLADAVARNQHKKCAGRRPAPQKEDRKT